MKSDRRKTKPVFPISWQTMTVVAVLACLVVLMNIISANIKKFEDWQKKQKDYLAIYHTILPASGLRRSLLLFSNNAEQRFGGGFIGSVGLLSSQAGDIHLEPVHSVYFYDHRVREAASYYPVPAYLQFLTDSFGLRDSAISANWPQSAQQAAKMYEIETGVAPDNVVNITPEVLKSLLEQTGPIVLPEYNLTVTKDNILTSLQLEVEQGKDKQENRDPKSILGLLATKIISSLSEKPSIDLYNNKNKLFDLFNRKQISLYSRDENTQKLIENYGLAANFNHFDGNLLAVTSANYGTDKSSPYIKQLIRQQLTIAADGTATAELKIKRTHTSDYQNHYIDPKLGPLWLVGVNKTYNQVFVPKGAKLLSSSLPSAKVTDESDRTAFGYDMITEPLHSQEISFSYQLPYKYQMNSPVVIGNLFEKQVGGYADDVEYYLSLPVGFRLTQANSRDLKTTEDGRSASWRGILESDQYVELVYEK